MDNFESRTLALAGVFRAAALADTLANHGSIEEVELGSSIESIFMTDPESVIEVYGSVKKLHTGLTTLVQQLGKDSRSRNIDIARYVVSMLFLERQLNKNTSMLDTLASGIEVAEKQAEHFSLTHENVIANLADLYTRTISQLGHRIMVNGEQHYLTTTAISNKIRTVLLAGIRSAVLWQQLGGRRWHILLQRRRYVETAQNFINHCELD